MCLRWPSRRCWICSWRDEGANLKRCHSMLQFWTCMQPRSVPRGSAAWPQPSRDCFSGEHAGGIEVLWLRLRGLKRASRRNQTIVPYGQRQGLRGVLV